MKLTAVIRLDNYYSQFYHAFFINTYLQERYVSYRRTEMLSVEIAFLVQGMKLTRDSVVTGHRWSQDQTMVLNHNKRPAENELP
jgi:hypothetical protein